MTSSKPFLDKVPDKVIVDEERFWQAADQFYSEEACLLKATLILSVVNLSTSYLTEEIRVLSGAYSRTLSGVQKPKTRSRQPTS